jgi:hypothetical protein
MAKTDEGNPVRHLHSFQPRRKWEPRASLQKSQPDSDGVRRQVDPRDLGCMHCRLGRMPVTLEGRLDMVLCASAFATPSLSATVPAW